MEDLYSDDRKLLSGIDGEVIPFPEPAAEATAGVVYHDHQHQPTPLISPAAAPPQKLRPIRNVTVEAPGNSNGNSNGIYAELGFQPRILPNGCLPFEPDDDSSALPLIKLKSQMDANFISSINSQISLLPSSFSSSSDGSADSSGKPEEAGPSVKPKSKKRKKLQSFLQDLMGQVIQKQEQMHQQLMEMIENKERDRVLREEAWKRQEMERAHKEQVLRSQEAARNLALLSFIQSALGQDIQMPQPLLPVLPGEDDGEPDPNNKMWPTSEVQALITLRTALDHKFQTMGPKASVWEEVSAGMANMGYNRNAEKCKEKWENINKCFRKAGGDGKKPSENAKSCPYFHELEALYRNQLITTGKANSPIDEDIRQEGSEG
uniref:Myb-like domain-containing protein n=1 Tax=Opuntia streptacantha TaxID=393608 RepID=A0A7C9AP55_OPUST